MLLFLVLDGPVDRVQILHAQLAGDGLQITDGVDRVVHVHDLVVLEAPHQVEDPVDSGDVAQEGVPQARPLAGTFDEPSNVCHMQVGRDLAGRFVQVAQVVKALVRHDTT